MLKESALVEAFNLKGAIEYNMKNCEAAREAMADAAPRTEEELDPVGAAHRQHQEHQAVPCLSPFSHTANLVPAPHIWRPGGAYHPAVAVHQPSTVPLQQLSKLPICMFTVQQGATHTSGMASGMANTLASPHVVSPHLTTLHLTPVFSVQRVTAGAATADSGVACRSHCTM